MNPKVGIVVVNWNKCADLLRMLDSLSVLEYDNHEIFVVDNASTDDSVQKLKKHSLKINLLVNSENLGGTGGFNSGIRFALDTIPCKYIWLLDNDATVGSKALSHLVDALESDASIGLAGSRVLNAGNPEYVVETGAFFDWRAGKVRPVERNILKSSLKGCELIDVDYVAVCSALAKVSALVDVGLMDERYFLFWDDMDWGIAFQKSGYRVVGVPASEVFHPAFTEYRSVVVDSYYGVRNQLLTFSKFKYHEGALVGMFHMLRSFAKISLLQMFSRKPAGVLGFCGYWDFLRGKWGKISWSISSLPRGSDVFEISPSKFDRILVLPTNVAHAVQLIDHLISVGASDIDVLVAEDRKELFSAITGCQLICIDYNRKKLLLSTLDMFSKLFLRKYDLSVKTSPEKISLFSFATKKSACYDFEKNRIFATKEGVWQIWKVFLATFFGEIVGATMFMLAWLRSFTLVRRKS